MAIQFMSAMALTRPDYMSVLFHERVGNVMLIACALWMFTGVMIMKKMIDFKI